jgi:hypothetical protein
MLLYAIGGVFIIGAGVRVPEHLVTMGPSGGGKGIAKGIVGT